MRSFNTSFISRRAYAKTLAMRAGLRYMESESCTVPFASKSTITVPPYRIDFTEDEEIAWWSSLIHETYHHMYPEDFVFLEKQKWKNKSVLSFVNNIVCDHHIEHDQWGLFDGRDEWMSKGRYIICKSIYDKMLDKDEEEDDTRTKLHSVLAFDTLIRSSWDKRLVALDFYNVINDKSKELLAALSEDETLSIDFLNAHTPKEVFEVAKRIVNIIEDDEDAAERQEQKMKEGSGNEEGEGESEEGKGEGDKALEKYEADFNELNFDHDEKEPHCSFAPLKIDYSSVKKGAEFDVLEPKVHDFTHDMPIKSTHYGTLFSDLSDSTALSQEIKRYLMVKARVKTETRKRRGRVHRRSAWKTNVYAGTPEAQFIFKQKTNKNALDTAVSLVVDHSGSMGGSKFVNSCHSAMLLNDVLQKIGVKCEIIGFTYSSCPDNIIHKTYDVPCTTEHLKASFAAAGSMMWNNSDGESILWSAERLLARKEKRKVMIVLSDGEPAGGGYGCYEFTEKVIRNLEPVIDLYAIGIEDDSVRNLYKNYTIINDSSELEDKMLQVLKKKVLGE